MNHNTTQHNICQAVETYDLSSYVDCLVQNRKCKICLPCLNEVNRFQSVE